MARDHLARRFNNLRSLYTLLEYFGKKLLPLQFGQVTVKTLNLKLKLSSSTFLSLSVRLHTPLWTALTNALLLDAQMINCQLQLQ